MRIAIITILLIIMSAYSYGQGRPGTVGANPRKFPEAGAAHNPTTGHVTSGRLHFLSVRDNSFDTAMQQTGDKAEDVKDKTVKGSKKVGKKVQTRVLMAGSGDTLQPDGPSRRRMLKKHVWINKPAIFSI